GQHGPVVTLQRRHQPLRIDREIGGGALFALAKVMRQVIGRQPLEVQRDPDPVRRAAAEIAMQLHRNLPRILSFASRPVIDATHIVCILLMLNDTKMTAGMTTEAEKNAI